MIGLIGKKIGMTQLFGNEGGELTPVTVIQVEENIVIQKRTIEKDGYNAVLLGMSDCKRVNKAFAGQFSEGIIPKRFLCEFRDFSLSCEQGQRLGVDIFENFSFVDITAFSKGRGFQGVMRRHSFHGGRKTHGSKFHRQAGSTGMAAYPARVLKGTRMPGRMGNVRRTVQNLRIMQLQTEQGVILVQGAVPGPYGGTVYIRSACKKEVLL